jgi:hypothetical protein
MRGAPRISFPDEDRRDGCGQWCRPLHMVEAAVAGQPFAKYFVVDDFMCMGMLHRKGRPDLILNKHIHTRRYLNLDANGHAYRYLPPPPGSESYGQYRLHVDLVAAIDNPHLYEMPWLSGSGFDGDQQGLSWEERWDHPDVRAWYARQERRTVRRRSR